MDWNLKKRLLIRRLIQMRHPLWTVIPESVQLDTQNFCNLDCQYCNVQHSFNLPKGQMPMEMISYILRYFGRKPFFSIAPFMNGEPMLDNRLPEICSMAKDLCNTMCVIDTNGTVVEGRKHLLHANLKIVRFTISAATPETYEIVHGKPLYKEAIETLSFFMQNKSPHQTAWLHFIATKDNIHELDQWIKQHQGIGRTIFPVHRSERIQIDSELVKTELMDKPFFVMPNNSILPTVSERVKKLKPCPCWDIMGIAWTGEILQCIDFPYRYNYGKVGERDLLEAWKERNRNGMDNDCCNSCSLRFATWKEVIHKWVR